MATEDIGHLDQVLEGAFYWQVGRPGRYIGGEVNQIRKDLAGCDIKVALCFPDVYEVGMSYTGLAVLYQILNGIEGVAAERVFAPWPDAERIMRDSKIPLFTLESKAPLASCDLVGFSLTTELCYSNVLNMIDLAGLPLCSQDRDRYGPLIVAGGGMAQCCEPLADFIDVFVLGDGEQAALELVTTVRDLKRAGADKESILLELATRFRWAYVPSLYVFEYQGDRIVSVRPKVNGLSVQRQAAVVEDLDHAPIPTRPVVPFVQAVHERVNLEIMRGCPGRCRFCQASFCKRPIRFRSVGKLIESAKSCYLTTGLEDICLLSLSSAEYPDLYGLIQGLREYFEPRHVGISVPSLRVDRDLRLIPELLTSVRKSGLTIAVEAAAQDLREIINKPISDADLFAAVQAAYAAGWQRIKLYFMVGLPGETEQDVRRIADLAWELAGLRPGRPGQVNCTVSWLVPKPHTPFQWLGQRPRVYLEQARSWILDQKARLQARGIGFRFHDIDRSILEAVLARADRRVGRAIERAWGYGARFDLWDECFNLDYWRRAFDSCGLDLEAMASRTFTEDQILPWEHLGGPGKQYLLGHLRDAIDLVRRRQEGSGS